MQIVPFVLFAEPQIVHGSSSVMLQQMLHSLILSLSFKSASESPMTSSAGDFARYIAILCAVFLPMLGSFESSSATLSNVSEVCIKYSEVNFSLHSRQI